MKRTPLYEQHVQAGGKMVPFAGWEMPVQYSGIIAEHTAVRERVGLFDVSHMGELWVTGIDAEAYLQYLTCNDVSRLKDGGAQYTAFLNECGGVIDDLIVYRVSSEKFLLCVNASNTDVVFQWMSEHKRGAVAVENASADFGQIAVQGPRALSLLSEVVDGIEVADIKRFTFVQATLANVPVTIARTGYTGEDGVEIFTPAGETGSVWECLLNRGEKYGVLPCGLGARDSLRLEAGYPLHGHELAGDVSALESGLAWIVKFSKGDFIGKDALLSQRDTGVLRVLAGFFLDAPGIARQGDVIFNGAGTEEIGMVTSGTKTPTLNRALGMARIKVTYSALDSQLVVRVRNREIEGHVVALPFYKTHMA